VLESKSEKGKGQLRGNGSWIHGPGPVEAVDSGPLEDGTTNEWRDCSKPAVPFSRKKKATLFLLPPFTGVLRTRHGVIPPVPRGIIQARQSYPRQQVQWLRISGELFSSIVEIIWIAGFVGS